MSLVEPWALGDQQSPGKVREGRDDRGQALYVKVQCVPPGVRVARLKGRRMTWPAVSVQFRFEFHCMVFFFFFVFPKACCENQNSAIIAGRVAAMPPPVCPVSGEHLFPGRFRQNG